MKQFGIRGVGPAVVACLAMSAQAWGAVVSVPASKDTSLYEDNGSASNGVGSQLFSGETNFFLSRRALLAFDVAGSVPAGSTITGVTLTLNMNQSISGGHPASLHRLSAAWGEGASDAGLPGGAGAVAQPGDATWTDRVFPGTLWTTPGGDFAAGASATTVVAGPGSYTWGSNATMVADAQGWLTSPATNFGYILIGNESTNPTAKRFDSRESLNAALRPSLTVTYTPPGGGGGPAPTLSQWGLILFSLLLLCVGTLAFGRGAVLAGAGAGVRGSRLGFGAPPFAASLYFKALAGIGALGFLGLALASAVLGGVPATDVAGTALATPILAYLIHLWLAPREE